MRIASIEQELAAKRATISPRYTPPPTPLRSRLIHGGALLLWVLLFARAFGGDGLFAWSAGLTYIGYDTVLLVFVFWQTLALLRRIKPPASSTLPAASVIVAAHDEERVLPATLRTLLAQNSPAAMILIADDGSTDGTAALLQAGYGLLIEPFSFQLLRHFGGLGLGVVHHRRPFLGRSRTRRRAGPCRRVANPSKPARHSPKALSSGRGLGEGGQGTLLL